MLRLRCALTISLTAACIACAEDGRKATQNVPAPVTTDAAGPSTAQVEGSDAAAALDAQQPPAAEASVPFRSDAGADANVTIPQDAALDSGAKLDATSGADGSVTGPDTSRDSGAADSSLADGSVTLPAAQPRTVRIGMMERTFLLYVPKSIDKSQPAPLVSVHHGFSMSGKIMEEISTWKNIAERERMVVAFPDGGTYLAPWNVGENVCNIGQAVAGPSDQDDLGFVKAIIESVHAEQPINRSAVFVAGFSMGGYFANHVGCQGRDFVRAMSAHSGGTYMGTCPGKPMPVLLIHGDADGLIDYECATLARGYWLERNGCTSQVTSEPIKGGSCDWNQGCPAGRELGLCTMKGMDHGWAGAPTSGPGAWLTAPLEGNLGYGGGVQYEDAAELIWKFFKKYL